MTGTHGAVVPVANGTAALHALVYAWALHRGRSLRWATQAFTFPSSMQAALAEVLVVDLDAEHYGPSIRDLEYNKERLDGIIVTNVFALSADLSKYEDWCAENDKLMLLDNAATPLGTIDGRCIHDIGDGAMVSLHETKAIGRGEGGAAFVPKELERDFQRVICFGFDIANGQRMQVPMQAITSFQTSALLRPCPTWISWELRKHCITSLAFGDAYLCRFRPTRTPRPFGRS